LSYDAVHRSIKPGVPFWEGPGLFSGGRISFPDGGPTPKDGPTRESSEQFWCVYSAAFPSPPCPNVNARLRLAIVSALLGLLVLRQDRQQRLGGDNALVSGFPGVEVGGGFEPLSHAHYGLGSRSTTHGFDANYGANGIVFGHALGERYYPQPSQTDGGGTTCPASNGRFCIRS
jgi:hypothetical protein